MLPLFKIWGIQIKLNHAAAAALTLAGTLLGGYAALYRVSEYDRLQERAAAALAGTKRSVSFNPEYIERSLFPRPTVVLHNVVLTDADGKSIALRAERIRIGVAWSSLFGEPAIEKLVLDDADAYLSRDSQNRWNIADLWDTRNRRPASFNRVQVNKGRLFVRGGSGLGEAYFDGISLALGRTGDGFSYAVSAQAHSPYWDSFYFNGTGSASSDERSLKFPETVLKFSGKENGYSFSGSLKTNAAWRDSGFSAQNTRLEAASFRYGGTLNASIAEITSRMGNSKISGINIAFNAPSAPYRPNAAFSAAQAQWQDGEWQSRETSLELNMQDDARNALEAGIKGTFSYRMGGALDIRRAKFVSTQTPAAGAPRFVTELEGSLKIAGATQWQAQMQGLFDAQPARFSLKREGAAISGSLNLAKLSLKPYENLLQGGSAAIPFPEGSLAAKISADIGTLETKTAQIDGLRAEITADSKHIALSPVSADLYSGHISGSLNIANRTPLEFALKQKAENIEIRPLLQDLFQTGELSGKGTAEIDLTAQGSSREELLSTLSGSLKLDVADGEWTGISVAGIRRLLAGGRETRLENEAMPFSRFSVDAHLENGISRSRTIAALTRPAAKMESEGTIDWNKGEISSSVLFQGAGERTPLPIRISGSLHAPAVSLDFQKMTSGLATAEEKQRAVGATLKQQWQWLLNQPQK